jgi:hypothetical protein
MIPPMPPKRPEVALSEPLSVLEKALGKRTNNMDGLKLKYGSKDLRDKPKSGPGTHIKNNY